MDEMRDCLYVYRDYGDALNHFTQKAKMAGLNDELVHDMDENWRDNPHSGTGCLRCHLSTRLHDWGGWMFLNGFPPEGETVPRPNDGHQPNAALDLTGAVELRSRCTAGCVLLRCFALRDKKQGCRNDKNVVKQRQRAYIKAWAKQIALKAWFDYSVNEALILKTDLCNTVQRKQPIRQST